MRRCNGSATPTHEQIAAAAKVVAGKSELDAMVAYLQGLGRHAPRGN
jgi:cytochrome c oxidase cbb3-type subunit 2